MPSPVSRRRVPWLTAAPTRTLALPSGAATAVGSLPHTDACAAVRDVTSRLAELPAAPQLPRAPGGSTMVTQWLAHLPCVDVDQGRLVVDPDVDPTACALTDARPDFDSGAHTGLVEFCTALAGRTQPVKVQITGPVTLSMGLVDAGVSRSAAIEIATTAAVTSAAALVHRVRQDLPEAPLLVVVDEPGLVSMAHPAFPLRRRRVRNAIADVFAAATSASPGVMTGIHCCGPTDWRVALAAGPDVVSVPVDVLAPEDHAALAAFVRRGGWIAWGAVPTDGPVGDAPDRLWTAMAHACGLLVEAGAPAQALATQYLITPACGLAHHDPAGALHLLDVTASLAGAARSMAA